MISCIVKIKLDLNLKHDRSPHERIQIHNFTVISRVIYFIKYMHNLLIFNLKIMILKNTSIKLSNFFN